MGRVEVGIFAAERNEVLAERADREVSSYILSDADELVGNVQGLEITDKEKREEALAKARQLRSAQEEDDTTILGRTFVRDADKANAFSKQSRYATAISRELYRALHELERRQAARRGGDVPAPHVVDVDVSGIPEGDS